jgi:Cdc6-like AAA superfamily ATPase
MNRTFHGFPDTRLPLTQNISDFVDLIFSNETRFLTGSLTMPSPQTSMTLLDDETPLTPSYTPDKLLYRESTVDKLETEIPGTRNLHIHGSRGTGKTQTVKKAVADSETRFCYLSCIEYDTQYQVLREVLRQLTKEPVSTGHHTSELQRRLKKQVEVLDTVIILDELDFLLLNYGDNLLYFLSRLANSPQIITVSANTRSLREILEPRTFSSLQPQGIQLEPYTGDQVYRILADRASKSLKPQSIHRNALTYSSSQIQDISLGLTWVKTAIKQAENAVTEKTVEETQEEAYEKHTETQLEKLGKQHRLLYRAITGLDSTDSVLNTGRIYKKYQKIADREDEDILSNRRISDYLKHLEKLNLVEAEYHYGGKKGKTREVRTTGPDPDH